MLAWREVPVNPTVLGEASLATVPTIEQAFFAPCVRLLTEDGTFGGIGFANDDKKVAEQPSDDQQQPQENGAGSSASSSSSGSTLPKVAPRSEGLERALYFLRRKLRGASDEASLGMDSLYVASLSSRTITYKGMVRGSKYIYTYMCIIYVHVHYIYT